MNSKDKRRLKKLEKKVNSIVDDLSVVVKTLGDLQDRYENNSEDENNTEVPVRGYGGTE